MVIPRGGGKAEIEFYSLTVKLYKHQAVQQNSQNANTVAGVTGGIANFALSKCYLYVNSYISIFICIANSVEQLAWLH